MYSLYLQHAERVTEGGSERKTWEFKGALLQYAHTHQLHACHTWLSPPTTTSQHIQLTIDTSQVTGCLHFPAPHPPQHPATAVQKAGGPLLAAHH